MKGTLKQFLDHFLPFDFPFKVKTSKAKERN